MMTNLILNLDPVAWGRVKRGRYGQAYVPAKTRTFERAAASMIRLQWKKQPLDGAVKLSVTFYIAPLKRPNKKQPYPSVRPDLDNFLKAIKDAANGVLWKDDGQVVRVEATKLYNTGPRGEIHISVGPFQPESK